MEQPTNKVLTLLNIRPGEGKLVAPRLASVTALAETRLLRLDQAPFYEIVEARPEVARGMIRVLAHHLRNRIDDISRAGAQPVTE